MTEATPYERALTLLNAYDKARADLRDAEALLKIALREYSNEQRYGCYIGIDTFRATVTTRERKIA